MSVYRDTNTAVTFTHPVGVPLTATVTRENGTVSSSAGPISPVSGSYTYNLTYHDTQYDGKLTITWTGTDEMSNPFSRAQAIEVVTPLVTTSQLQTIFTQTPPAQGDLIELENTIRAIIETYVGQTFGYSYGVKTYTGTGAGKLILKDRLANLVGILGGLGMATSDTTQLIVDANGNPVLDGNGNPTYKTNLNGELNTGFVSVIQDGWTILMDWPQFLTLKQAPPEDLIQFAPSQDGTIRVPRRYWAEYDQGTQYTITAGWGYDAVPDEIQEAALLLANDYVTNDSGYRDRYLEILKIQQDSWTYHPGAFRGTGNARVDLLLGPYRRQNGMVII